MMQCKCAAFDQCGEGILQGKRRRALEQAQARNGANPPPAQAASSCPPVPDPCSGPPPQQRGR
jgi:hypothetical protein